jgi:hypothetical protein
MVGEVLELWVCFLFGLEFRGVFSQGLAGTTLMTVMTRQLGGMEQVGGINFVAVYN